LQADGKVWMEMADEDAKSGTTISSGALPEKKWTHLAITVDRKNFKTKYYLNGRLDSTKDIPRNSTGRLNVSGKSLSTGTWQPYIGLLAELRIYRRLLKDSETSAHYEEGRKRYVSGAFSVIPDE
jgi:hypothetical protein